MEIYKRMQSIVKQKMKEKGVKQKFLAEKCGYDERTFSLLLNGRKLITGVDVKKFCEGLDVCPNDIILLDKPLQLTGT